MKQFMKQFLAFFSIPPNRSIFTAHLRLWTLQRLAIWQTIRLNSHVRQRRLLLKMICKGTGFLPKIFTIYCSPIFRVPNDNSIQIFYRRTSISQRQCRFNSESNLTHYPIYTRGLCLQECRLNMVYKQCGCIPHFYPNRSKLFELFN